MGKILMNKSYPTESTYSGQVGEIQITGYGSEYLSSISQLLSSAENTAIQTVNRYGYKLLHLTVWEEETSFMGWTTPLTKYRITFIFGSPNTSLDQRGMIIGIDDAIMISMALAFLTAFTIVAGGVIVTVLLSADYIYTTYMVSHASPEVAERIKDITDKVGKAIEDGTKTIEYIAIGAVLLGAMFLAYSLSKEYSPEIHRRLGTKPKENTMVI